MLKLQDFKEVKIANELKITGAGNYTARDGNQYADYQGVYYGMVYCYDYETETWSRGEC